MKTNHYHHGNLRRALIERAVDIIDNQGIEALTLRGLARDLGVSHGAPNRHFRNKQELLAALATEAYEQAEQSTISAAQSAGDNPILKLNAIGRGYIGWALDNRALFNIMNHPDIKRSADSALIAAMRRFQLKVRAASVAAQQAGRYPDTDSKLLALYNNSVPFGAAQLIDHPVFAAEINHIPRDELIEQLMELVVPIKQIVGAAQ
ncbi:MAG: TetR/AcrR family transcriptional regulator [Pseudomonadota bacterium]